MLMIYPFGLFIVLLFLSFLFPGLLQEQNLLNYDAIHYQQIAVFKYVGMEVAFFPLFPKIWGLLNLTAFGASVMNAIIFLLSLYFLKNALKIEKKWFPFILGIPGVVFFMVPYTESFFFLGSTLMIIGIKRDEFLITSIGLLIACLSRPAFTVFIPAMVILFVLKKGTLKNKIKRLGLYIGVMILGAILVGLIQFADTGEWFQYFNAQGEWDNSLRIPSLPLRSWDDQLVIRYDGLALLIGLVCSGILIKELIKTIKRKEPSKIPIEVLFSLLYLAGISFAVLLFRGGSLFSLNRFVFSTAFFIVVLHYYLTLKWEITWKTSLFIFLGFNVYWLLFGSYVHIAFLMKFVLLSIFLWIFLLMKLNNDKVWKMAYWFSLIVMFQFQIYLIIRYLDGKWIA